MKNGYKLIWTKRAYRDLEQILDYLGNNFSQLVIRNFIIKLERRTNLITENPFIFPSSSSFQNVRKSVMTKQVSLYYKVVSNQIFLLSIYDNRQLKNRILTK